MNKTNFIEAMKIKNPTVAGDTWHNQDVDYFLDGLVQNHMTRKVQAYIVACAGDVTWIDRIFTKGDLRWLNSMCKAKSKATLQKRKEKYVQHQLKSHYGALFNRNKIEKFLDMVV